MKIFIINLQRSTARKQAMQQKIAQIAEADCPAEVVFFNAIDARAGQHRQYAQYLNHWRMKFYFGRVLSEGEMGCYASHFALWQICVCLNEPIIILEDDILFCDDFFAGVKRIIDSHYAYVRLSWLWTPKKPFDASSGYFYSAYHGLGGTQGYYLTPQAAKKFSSADYWVMPVDNYLDATCLHQVATILHVPPLLTHDYREQSTINNSSLKKPNLFWKITREMNRLLIQIKTKWYQHTH